MTTELVPIERGRLAVTGIDLPSPPPTRVYIAGRMYRLAPDTRIPLPPIANVAKVIFNWIGPGVRLARNIWYVLTGGGFVTSDPVKMQSLANQIQGLVSTDALLQTVHNSWQLASTTVKDAGGTSTAATSTSPAVHGVATGNPLPPQTALTISWRIAASYRGGKPRWYFPGVPDTGLVTPGDSSVSSTFAGLLQTKANTFMGSINGMTITGGGTFQIGTVSYYHAHSVRPTPIFEQFNSAQVHERLDSQRRRSGKESGFGSVP